MERKSILYRKVGIGHQDFEKIRKNNNFYIDKTKLIKEWWEAEDEVTLIARPRRFGKTLNMSMLEKFFSMEYAGREELFEGLSIWEEEKYRKLQGTYPVISLSFANVKEESYEKARYRMCQTILELYMKKRFLLEGDLLAPREKAYFERVSEEMREEDATISLHHLSDFLCRYYDRKVLILLDEYDTPMQEAYVNGYWEEMAGFTRNLFHAAFKTNPYLERGIMTGITRVSKESIFSDLNNLKVVTATSEEYADSFGFTEQEVFQALEEYGLSERKEEVKNWYDGFIFGNQRDIYNPWSMINYLDTRKIGCYWANSSSNDLVGKLIREGNRALKQDFERLLRGEAVNTEIDEQLLYHQLLTKKNAIWSLLLASGYVKASEMEFQRETGRWYYKLILTNQEVRLMFEHMIRDWFTEQEDAYNDFIKALMLGDEEAMNHYMNKVALASFSYFDTGKEASQAEPERFYHGFVLGLMVELRDRYVLTSNRESGFGRYDVMLEPRNQEDDGIIVEFKVYQPKKEKGLQETVKNALKQIEEKKYETMLLEKGIPREKIRKYGFAFRGREVLIGR